MLDLLVLLLLPGVGRYQTEQLVQGLTELRPAVELFLGDELFGSEVYLLLLVELQLAVGLAILLLHLLVASGGEHTHQPPTQFGLAGELQLVLL